MPATFIINFTATPEKLASFKDILAGVKDSLPQAPGCLGVQIYAKAGDPASFTLVESWESAESHKRHVDRIVASGQWAHIASHLAGDPASGYFEAL